MQHENSLHRCIFISAQHRCNELLAPIVKQYPIISRNAVIGWCLVDLLVVSCRLHGGLAPLYRRLCHRENLEIQSNAGYQTKYQSGPCKGWIKVRNPNSPAYMRIADGTF